jgi:hypothetical protein
VSASSLIAMTALLLAVGCEDDELDEVYEVLRRKNERVPDNHAAIAADARRALAEVRERRTRPTGA